MSVDVKIRLISLIVGYFLGCILTGEIVAYKLTGRSAKYIGTSGNPGMANITAYLGVKPGIVVLLGDLGKCLIAMLICGLLYGQTGVLYAGLGSTLGHDFPFWRKFKGGKGVAASSLAFILYSFPLGAAANIAGMLTVFATQYLCIGGVVIPIVFAVGAFLFYGTEPGLIGIIYSMLSLRLFWNQLITVPKGTCHKDDVLGGIIRILKKKEKGTKD